MPEMAEAPRYRQNPAVTTTEVDGEIFLVEPETQEVFYLDAIGAAFWRLIAEPQDLETAVAIYGAAFPDADRATIERDLGAALQILLDRGLVLVLT